MSRRKLLTTGALYTLLSEELRKVRPAACVRCRMPLPYVVERPDAVSANWRIGTPPPCEHGCDAFIAEIVTKMWPLFDLMDPYSSPARPRDSR